MTRSKPRPKEPRPIDLDVVAAPPLTPESFDAVPAVETCSGPCCPECGTKLPRLGLVRCCCGAAVETYVHA